MAHITLDEFPDVMVDIETTGTDVGVNAIIQIAAVRFNLEAGTVHHGFFDRCLQMAPRRCWDEGTRDWWMKKPDVIQSIWARGEDPGLVLKDFSEWCGSGLRMWAKPTHFDFAFLENYYTQFDSRIPFHFRTAENMNSWIRGRYWPRPAPDFERDLPFEGTAHNGLHDCLHQVKVLFAVKEDTKTQVLIA